MDAYLLVCVLCLVCFCSPCIMGLPGSPILGGGGKRGNCGRGREGEEELWGKCGEEGGRKDCSPS